MKMDQNSVSGGLSTDTCIVDRPGLYSMLVRTTMDVPSGLTITLAQTGSTSNSQAFGPATAVQIDINAQKSFQCAAGDTLTCVISSSAPGDAPPSKIKTTISLGRIS